MDIKKFFGRKSLPETPENPREEKLTRELSIHANQRPSGKSFNRKMIYGLVVVCVVTFVYALLFGLDTKKKIKEEDESNQVVVRGDHLANVPKKYSDIPPEPKKKEKGPAKEPAARPNYAPATAPYTPVPTMPMRQRENTAPRSGLSAEEKIRLERLKEKLAANQSPIRFNITGEEEKTNDRAAKKEDL